MEINKDKYLKDLKKLGLDELKAKSFLYDLERDLSLTRRGKELDQELDQAKKKNRSLKLQILGLKFKRLGFRGTLYTTMFLVMIGFLIWIYTRG